MINPCSQYRHAGQIAGRAVTHDDWGLYRHQSDWFKRAVVVELSAADKKAASDEWTVGYQQGRQR